MLRIVIDKVLRWGGFLKSMDESRLNRQSISFLYLLGRSKIHQVSFMINLQEKLLEWP